MIVNIVYFRTHGQQLVFGQLNGRNPSDEWQAGDCIEALFDEAT